MIDIMSGLAVFAVVIAAGWLLVRTGAVAAGADTILTRVCFYASTPALLLITVAKADLATLWSPDTAAGLLAETLGVLTAGLIHRVVLHRSVADTVIGALAGGYVNAANLGIPVLILLLGSAQAIAPILLLQLLILSPTAFAILDWCVQTGRLAGGPHAGEPVSRAHVWFAPLRNPLLLGVLGGLIVNLTGGHIDTWLDGFVAGSLNELGKLAVTLMMLALGMSLAASSPKVTKRLTVSQVTRLNSDAAPRPRPGAAPAAAPASGISDAEASPREDASPESVAGAGPATDSGEGSGSRQRAASAMSQPAAGGEFDDTPDRGPALWVSVAWKLLVVPALAVLLGLAFGLRGAALLTPITTAALPCAQNVFMYATRYGAAKPLARDCVLITTAGFVPVVLLAAAILR